MVKIQAQAREQMGKNNVVFTKDGLRVNVKNVQNESYLDQTQSFFVKAWELGSASGANEADDATKRQRCVSLCMCPDCGAAVANCGSRKAKAKPGEHHRG